MKIEPFGYCADCQQLAFSKRGHENHSLLTNPWDAIAWILHCLNELYEYAEFIDEKVKRGELVE